MPTGSFCCSRHSNVSSHLELDGSAFGKQVFHGRQVGLTPLKSRASVILSRWEFDFLTVAMSACLWFAMSCLTLVY